MLDMYESERIDMVAIENGIDSHQVKEREYKMKNVYLLYMIT